MTSAKSSPYALVTGASSGIGTAFAHELAQQGKNLVLVARRIDRLESLAQELSGKHGIDVRVFPSDLGLIDAAADLYHSVKTAGIEVDILINNAGVGIQGDFLEMDTDKIQSMLVLNIHSLTMLSQFFGRDMAKAGKGHILQVASMAAFIPTPYVSAYAATKAFVGSFSDAIRHELKHKGVKVTTLYPGITTTEFNEVANAQSPKLMNASVLSAESVAQIGLKAMYKGKRKSIPGFINNVTAIFSALTPRGILVGSAGDLMAKANKK
jgi:short-subunit dehydrogenase